MYEYIECFIEVVFGLGIFINAILFIPQAMKIYRTKNAAGVSIAIFAGFNKYNCLQFCTDISTKITS
jgi:uncharacterized protein with PQ loop repeat